MLAVLHLSTALPKPRAATLKPHMPAAAQMAYELYEDRAVHGEELHLVHHKESAPTMLAQLKTKVTFDPEKYPGTACAAWCTDDVKIDRVAAAAAGRTAFPDNYIADDAEKCSWDKYCSGCDFCMQQEYCDPMCGLIADPTVNAKNGAPWKKQTRSWRELCGWGICHDCPRCLDYSPSVPPPPFTPPPPFVPPPPPPPPFTPPSKPPPSVPPPYVPPPPPVCSTSNCEACVVQHDLNQDCTYVDHGGHGACMNTAETHFCGCSATVYGGPITAPRERAGVASCPGAPPRPVCSVSNCGACVVQHDYNQDCSYDTDSKACMSTAKTHFCACTATVYFGPVKEGGQACPKPKELDSEMDTSFAESYHRVPPIEPLAPGAD